MLYKYIKYGYIIKLSSKFTGLFINIMKMGYDIGNLGVQG